MAYNQAGREAKTYYVAAEDVCGYMTDDPCPILVRANYLIERALQHVTEVAESDVESVVKAKAWQTYNLVREIVSRCGKTTNGNTRGLMCAWAEKIMETF